MANKTIKIDADFKSFTKGFQDLDKQLNKLGTKKIKLSVDDQRFREAIKYQQDVIANTERRVKQLSLAMSESFNPEKIKKYRKEVQDLNEDIKNASQTLKGLGGDKSGQTSSTSSSMMNFAKAGLLIGSLTAMTKAIYSPTFAAAQSRLQLRGYGLNSKDIKNVEGSGYMMGYSPTESREQAGNLMRATGKYGQLTNVQMLSRSIGADPNELIGMMGNMRNSGMSDKESISTLKDIFTDAVSAGFDSSRAIEVLGAISEHVGSMAKQGNVSAEGIKSSMSMLMHSGSFFSQNPNRAMGAMSGIDSTFTGGGPLSAIAFKTISQMYPNMSQTGKLYQMRQGLFKSGDSAELMTNQIGNLMNFMSPGKNLVHGGGGGQLSDDAKKNIAMGFKNSGVTQNDETAMALIDAFLEKSGNEAADIAKQQMDVQKDLQERMIDILRSSEMKLANIGTTMEYIRVGFADAMFKIGSFLNPGGRKDDSWSLFGPRVLGAPKSRGGAGSVSGTVGMEGAYNFLGEGDVTFKGNNASTKAAFNRMKLDAPALYSAFNKLSKKMPVRLNSTERSAIENSMLPGASPNSLHLLNRAGDMSMHGLSDAQVKEALTDLNNTPGVSASIHSPGTSNKHIHAEVKDQSLSDVLTALTDVIKDKKQTKPALKSEITTLSKHWVGQSVTPQ